VGAAVHLRQRVAAVGRRQRRLIPVEPWRHRQQIDDAYRGFWWIALNGGGECRQQRGDRLLGAGDGAARDRRADERGGDALGHRLQLVQVRRAAVEVPVEAEATVARDDETIDEPEAAALDALRQRVDACGIDPLVAETRERPAVA